MYYNRGKPVDAMEKRRMRCAGSAEVKQRRKEAEEETGTARGLLTGREGGAQGETGIRRVSEAQPSSGGSQSCAVPSRQG